MIHIAMPNALDDFAREVEAATGHTIRWSTALPLCCALQWDRTRHRAGLVYRHPAGHLGFAILSFDDALVARCDIGPEDLAMIGLSKLGMIELGDMPRTARRCVKVRPVPPATVQARKP